MPGQIASGKLKALAVTAKDRTATLPDVPTMIEAGVADFVVATWLGFAVPANTPEAVVSRFNAEINRSICEAAINSTVFAPLAIITMDLSKFVATWG